MKKLTIKVTKEDIKLGTQEGPTSCAIARAVKKMGLKNVYVENNTILFGKKGDTQNIPLPKKAKDFIRKFDIDKTRVSPFEFSVTVAGEI